jgi:hypothetical protein
MLSHRAEATGVCTKEGFAERLASVAPARRGHFISNCTLVGSRAPGGGSALANRAGMPPLVVGGCARGIAKALTNHSIPYLDGLLLAARAHRLFATVVIFHDDPNDNATLGVLRSWAQRQRRVQLVLSDSGSRGERIQRLTLCRNVLLAEATSRLRLVSGGYFAQLDLDCRHGEPWALLRAVERMREAAALVSEIGGADRSPKYGVITANNLGAYRDMWALRSPTLLMDYDCFWDFRRMRSSGNCKKHRIFINPSATPFAVDAAFNGLAIYSASTLLDAAPALCRYANETHDADDRRRIHVVSEHVPYQMCLREQGVRIAIAPELLTYCHDWMTRHDAKRTYYLRNGTVVRLLNRHAKPDPGWTSA